MYFILSGARLLRCSALRTDLVRNAEEIRHNAPQVLFCVGVHRFGDIGRFEVLHYLYFKCALFQLTSALHRGARELFFLKVVAWNLLSSPTCFKPHFGLLRVRAPWRNQSAQTNFASYPNHFAHQT